jgi:hypothetical protein
VPAHPPDGVDDSGIGVKIFAVERIGAKVQPKPFTENDLPRVADIKFDIAPALERRRRLGKPWACHTGSRRRRQPRAAHLVDVRLEGNRSDIAERVPRLPMLYMLHKIMHAS